MILEWWSFLYLHLICQSDPCRDQMDLENDCRQLYRKQVVALIAATVLDVAFLLWKVNKA